MDRATLDFALSIVAHHHNQWTSGNIIVTVLTTLDSDDGIEIDLCETLRVQQQQPESAYRLSSWRFQSGEISLEVSSEFRNFGIISPCRIFSPRICAHDQFSGGLLDDQGLG
jgi:hypothetical protein